MILVSPKTGQVNKTKKWKRIFNSILLTLWQSRVLRILYLLRLKYFFRSNTIIQKIALMVLQILLKMYEDTALHVNRMKKKEDNAMQTGKLLEKTKPNCRFMT